MFEKSKKKKSEGKNQRKIKRKSSAKKTSVKKTWDKFISQSDSKTLLKNIWKSDNIQKEYSEKIIKLHKKYCN